MFCKIFSQIVKRRRENVCKLCDTSKKGNKCHENMTKLRDSLAKYVIFQQKRQQRVKTVRKPRDTSKQKETAPC